MTDVSNRALGMSAEDIREIIIKKERRSNMISVFVFLLLLSSLALILIGAYYQVRYFVDLSMINEVLMSELEICTVK